MLCPSSMLFMALYRLHRQQTDGAVVVVVQQHLQLRLLQQQLTGHLIEHLIGQLRRVRRSRGVPGDLADPAKQNLQVLSQLLYTLIS